MFSRPVVFLLLAFLTSPSVSLVQAQERPQFRLFPIREGDKYGFINRSGKVVISPRFTEIGARSEGTWAVAAGEKWGFVSEAASKVSISPRFQAVGKFSEGLCAVAAGNKVGFIGQNGIFQIGPRFRIGKIDIIMGTCPKEIRFKAGMAPVEVGESELDAQKYPGAWGFIDRLGKWKIAPQFSDANPMSDGMALVTRTTTPRGQYGYVSTEGRFISLPKDAIGWNAEPFFEGLAAVPVGIREAQRFGFIDKEGRWAIEPKFPMVLAGADPIEMSNGFYNGLATVLTGASPEAARIGWIDRSGQWAIEPRFTGGGVGFIQGVTPARKGEKQGEGLGGYIDRTGKFVIEPQYEKMGIFSDELAPVQKKGEKWGYIDKNGATVIEPRFDYLPVEQLISNDMMALHFRDGLAYVAEGETRGYINLKGQWVWKHQD